MRCPKCNFENRPDARFCKRCGQPLAAPPAPPAQVAVCSACGVTAKPGARFCPRCGQPLPTTPPAQPQGYAQPPIQPPPAAQPQAYTPPPAPPPPSPAPSRGYAQSPAVPPPPAAQPSAKRATPRWLWPVVAAVVFLCIIATTVVVGPKIFGTEKEPVATLTPVESPTMESPAIETATEMATEAPTEAPTEVPTETATEAVTEAPTEVPTETPAPIFDAQITTSPLTGTVRVGDSLTVTVTLANKGNVSFGKLRYQLSGGWESALELETGTVVSHDAETVPPDGLDTATFIFKGLQAGDVTFHVNVTLEVQEESPRWESRSSEIISISVVQ